MPFAALMRTLAIDCATEACSVALFHDGALLAFDHNVLGRGHAEFLVPMIAALPDRGKADRILVSRGPGSFTGVRIGIAAARALGVAWECEVLGYPTLALIAAMARSESGMQPVSVAMSGGHGEWFVQNFDSDGLPQDAHASLSPDASVLHCRHELIVGTQAEALVAARGSGVAQPLHPDARFAALLPQALLTSEVSPIYGRAPDAKPAGS